VMTCVVGLRLVVFCQVSAVLSCWAVRWRPPVLNRLHAFCTHVEEAKEPDQPTCGRVLDRLAPCQRRFPPRALARPGADRGCVRRGVRWPRSRGRIRLDAIEPHLFQTKADVAAHSTD
jgi:hypothetical protein